MAESFNILQGCKESIGSFWESWPVDYPKWRCQSIGESL